MMMLRCLAIFGITMSYASKGSALGHPPLDGFQRTLTENWSPHLYEYKLENVEDNWQNHRQAALEWGGDLVSIHSLAENTYVHDMVKGIIGNRYWQTGGKRKYKNPDHVNYDTFLWTDGTPFDYSKWKEGEPNGKDHVKQMVVLGGENWMDISIEVPQVAVYKKRNDFSHWEINAVNTSIVDDEGQGPLIKLQFNMSNRYHSTRVLQDDCETDFTGLAESGISLINTPLTPSGQFIQYDSLIKINHTAFINNDTYWTNISDTLGFMEICVLTELYLDETEPKETVNFLSNLINITYDADGNFDVLEINVTRTGPEESEVAVDYSTYLEAYQCTPDNLSVKNTQTYSQGSVLMICVKGDGDVVAVETIKQLSVKQGISPAFEYISNSNGYNSAIVNTDCEEVDSNPICSAQLRLLGRFFSSNNPENLEVTGAVTMTFPSNGDRRLSRPVFQYNDLESSRHLQDVSDSGAFNVEVELEKIEDSVKSQSILSAHTKYYLSSVALCYVFGLLWYIA